MSPMLSPKRALRTLSTVLTLSLGLLCQAGNYIVCQLDPNANPGAIATNFQMRYLDHTVVGNFYLFYSSADADTIEASLRLNPAVIWAETDEAVRLSEADTTSRGGTLPVIGSRATFGSENAHLLQQIGWFESDTVGAAPVRVAVLDTGISPLATAIKPHVIYCKDQIRGGPGWGLDVPNFTKPLNDPANLSYGHGTMVAGIIATLAPNAQLIVEKVAGSDGKARSWSVIRGLTDAVAQNAQVCNISLGSPTHIFALENVVQWCGQQGMQVIAPIGNDSLQVADQPAAFEGVICVSGVDANDVKASYSNWDSRANVAAPSDGIRSYDWNGHLAIWSGTSFSAPQVTAAITVALGQTSSLTNDMFVSLLRNSGDSIDPLNPAYRGKLGNRLNFRNFLNLAKAAVPQR